MFTVHAVFPTNRSDYIEPLAQMYRQRYRVFVEILGWDIPGVDHARRLEIDAFDREDTVYLLIMEGDDVMGASRMIPTTAPTMMSEVWPDLCTKAPPSDPTIWEWSRGHVNPDMHHSLRSKTLDHVFVGGYEFAQEMGVRNLTAQINADEQERWLARGLFVTTLGEPVNYENGDRLLAFMHTINVKTVNMVRNQTGLRHVVRLPEVAVQQLAHS